MRLYWLTFGYIIFNPPSQKTKKHRKKGRCLPFKSYQSILIDKKWSCLVFYDWTQLESKHHKSLQQKEDKQVVKILEEWDEAESLENISGKCSII